MTASRALAAAVAAIVLVPAAATGAMGATAPIDDDFTTYGRVVLDDGERLGPWRVVFDGDYAKASVRIRPGALRLVPQPAATADETYSALVVSRQRFSTAPLHVSATWTTRATTRVGTANAWEVGWLVWDYVDNDHFTYLVLKPNGWEVGRRDPRYPGGQRFLYDDVAPVTPIGQERTVTVDRVGRETTIRVDGDVLVSYPLPARERRGSVGMYTEDAVVDWWEFTAEQSD
jgi:hypothetical protein